jgi:hypothetical protein
MKINESRLIEIIKEEMAAIEDKQHDQHIDEEGGMARSQLFKIAKYAIMLHDALDDNTQLESWVQSKITIASEYVSKVTHYLEYEMNWELQEPEFEMEYPEEHDTEDEDSGETTDIYDINDEDSYLMET